MDKTTLDCHVYIYVHVATYALRLATKVSVVTKRAQRTVHMSNSRIVAKSTSLKAVLLHGSWHVCLHEYSLYFTYPLLIWWALDIAPSGHGLSKDLGYGYDADAGRA